MTTNNEKPRESSSIFDDDIFSEPVIVPPKKQKKAPDPKAKSQGVKKPKSPPQIPPEMLTVSQELGFSSRDPNAPKIDGRTARRTGRNNQMRLLTRPETHEEMKSLSEEAGYQSMGHFLERLIEVYKINEK